MNKKSQNKENESRSEGSKANADQNNSAKELPAQLKSGVEALSGVDMGDTQVHKNSALPAQFKAHAFAQGSDIHLASGQEKHLPHEAWHVAQQKQGRVQPTKQLKGKTNINDDPSLEKEADVMGAKALTVDVAKEEPLQKKVSVSGHAISQLIVQRSEWEEDEHGLQKLKNGEEAGIQWFARGPQEMWFEITTEDSIPADKLDSYKSYMGEGNKKTHGEWRTINFNSALDFESEDTIDAAEKFAQVIDVPGQLSDITANAIDRTHLKADVGGMLVDNDKLSASDKADHEHDKNALDITAGVGSTLVSFAGMAQSMKKLYSQGDKWAKMAAGEELLENTVSSASGVAKIVDSGIKQSGGKNDDADKAPKTLDAISAGISMAKNAFLGVKKLYDVSQGDTDNAVYDGIEGTQKIVSSAKDAVIIAKQAYDIIGNGIPMGVMMAVPGLSLAINAIDVVLRYFDYVSAKGDGIEMLKTSDTLRTLALDRYDQKSNKESSTIFSKYKAGKFPWYHTYYRTKGSIIPQLDKVANAAPENAQSEIDQIDSANLKQYLTIWARAGGSDEEAEEIRATLQEYELSDKLAEIADKRKTGAGNSIIADIIRISGNIATLSGAGAIAGAVIEGVVAATSGAKFVGVEAQRMYRNKTDSDHSDSKKHEAYVNHAKYIFSMVIKSDETGNESMAEKTKGYINATGASFRLFELEKNNPAKQASMLIEAMKKR